MLLDLNLPIKDGYEVLEQIRLHPNLQGTVVVVLSSEENPEKLVVERGLEASLYLNKCAGLAPLLDKLHEVVQRKKNESPGGLDDLSGGSGFSLPLA